MGSLFLSAGIYKTFLHGYKDGQVVVRDSAVTEIFADGYFLNVNWERLDQNPNKMVRFTNDDMQDYSLKIFTGLREDVALDTKYTPNQYDRLRGSGMVYSIEKQNTLQILEQVEPWLL